MANFFGGIGNDVANAAIGELTGFTGSVAELTDNIGDLFSGANGNDFVFAGNADDKIQGGEGHDALNGGGGDDVIFADTELSIASLIGDEIVGNLGNDRLYGANGDDVMEGGEGHDTLQGFGGNDLMRGGTGHDQMNGGAGVDAFDAGGGDDTLIFAPGDVLAGEIIDGGADFDRILVNGAVWFTDAASIAGIEMVELAGGVSVAILTASQVRTGLPANLLLDAANFQGTIETFRVEMGGETVLDVSGLTFGAFWEFSDRVDLVGDDDDEVIAGSARFDRIFGNYGNDTLAMAASIISRAAQATTSTWSTNKAAKSSRTTATATTPFLPFPIISSRRTSRTSRCSGRPPSTAPATASPT